MIERDIHFESFAKMLLDELKAAPHIGEEIDSFDERARLIIARRAYDLVHHATDFLDTWETHQALDHAYDWEYLFGLIPDLTAWPKSQE